MSTAYDHRIGAISQEDLQGVLELIGSVYKLLVKDHNFPKRELVTQHIIDACIQDVFGRVDTDWIKDVRAELEATEMVELCDAAAENQPEWQIWRIAEFPEGADPDDVEEIVLYLTEERSTEDVLAKDRSGAAYSAIVEVVRNWQPKVSPSELMAMMAELRAGLKERTDAQDTRIAALQRALDERDGQIRALEEAASQEQALPEDRIREIVQEVVATAIAEPGTNSQPVPVEIDEDLISRAVEALWPRVEEELPTILEEGLMTNACQDAIRPIAQEALDRVVRIITDTAEAAREAEVAKLTQAILAELAKEAKRK